MLYFFFFYGNVFQVDLEQYITEKNCLNEDEDHPIKYVFEENKSLYLQSDCDPEVIARVRFAAWFAFSYFMNHLSLCYS